MAQFDAAQVPAPAGLTKVYSASELEGLPAPVQRYFRAVLKDGQPLIATATFELAGTINMSDTGENWKLFTSWQRAVVHRPGLLWNGSVAMLPGLTARVHESHIAGTGRLHAAPSILLGHLQPSSVRVRPGSCTVVGDWLGSVGNSGNTGEPNWHVHAQSRRSAEATLGAEPRPIRLNGRFPGRGDRIEIP